MHFELMCACVCCLDVPVCVKGGQRERKNSLGVVYMCPCMKECSREAYETDAQKWVQGERKGLSHVSYKHVSKVPWRERGTVRTNG